MLGGLLHAVDPVTTAGRMWSVASSWYVQPATPSRGAEVSFSFRRPATGPGAPPRRRSDATSRGRRCGAAVGPTAPSPVPRRVLQDLIPSIKFRCRAYASRSAVAVLSALGLLLKPSCPHRRMSLRIWGFDSSTDIVESRARIASSAATPSGMNPYPEAEP